jgi:hypothetical protein
MIDAERRYGPCFRVLVRNLPQIINNTQLQHLFNKNGRMSDADIFYYNKIKRSYGIDILTISIVHDHLEDVRSCSQQTLFRRMQN